MEVKFKQWNCSLETAKYVDGNLAIKLIGTDLPLHDNKVATATTNLPGLAKDEVAIKDWSENEGMFKTLLDAGVITEPHRFMSSGYIESIPVCYLKTNL